jgi:hypothetical protein
MAQDPPISAGLFPPGANDALAYEAVIPMSGIKQTARDIYVKFINRKTA